MEKIEKLELKHLCGYLPHGLKFLTCYNIENNPVIEEMTLDYLQSLMDIPMNEKPLLLPLYALTEPLEDGSVPIVELAKIHDKFIDKLNSVSNENDGDGNYFMCHYLSDVDENISCHFVVTDNCEFQANALFHNSNFPKYETISVNNQLQLIEYLYSKHFDIYGLIPAGLAIDKRTLKI